MFLSFIVPVYNTEKYLAECLDSLLEQDIPHNDYEIICVNDGSTDGSLKILQSYAKKYSNVIVVDKKNGGVASARNVGLDIACGHYIWFFDSDDIILPNVLCEIQQSIDSIHPDRLKVGTYIFGAELTVEEKEIIQRNLLRVNSYFYDSSVCNSILRKDFLSQHNSRFHYPQITHGEDSIYMYELVTHSPIQAELDIPVYLYRNRPGSAQTSNSLESSRRKANSYLAAAIVMQQHWLNNDGNQRDTANLLMSFIWYTLYTSIQVPFADRKGIIGALRKAGLFPYQRPAECTHIRSYQTTRTDFIGKLFDKLYINMHRPWGFCGMVLLQRLISIKHYFRK